MNSKLRVVQIRSGLLTTDGACCFFGECCAALMPLQIAHGWSPSNVWVSACRKVVCFEYSISMAVHAADCNAAQCRPMARQSAKIVVARPIAGNITAE